MAMSSMPAPSSFLSPRESLSPAGLASQLSRPDAFIDNPLDLHTQPHPDASTQAQFGFHERSHLEATSLDTLTSVQLEALLMQPRPSSFTSPSLTSSTAQSLSPSLLHTQAQSFPGLSLGISNTQSLAPTPTRSLSRPQSLAGSPHPVSSNGPPIAYGSHMHNIEPLNLKMGGATDLKFATDLKLGTNSLTSRTSSFSSSLSAASSQPSSFVSSSSGSQRQKFNSGSSRMDVLNDGMNLGKSQRPSFSSSARPSFGVASAEKPSFDIGGSERPSFGVGSSQRPSQRPNFGPSTHRSTVFLGAASLDDDVPMTSSSAQIPATSQPPGLRPAPMSLSLPTTRSASYVWPGGPAGSTLRAVSPPSLNESSGVTSNWPDLSSVAPPKATTEHISSKAPALAQSTLDTHSSSASDLACRASEPQPSKDPCTTKANGAGEVDCVTTALGTLGMRRANKAHNKPEEKKQSSTLSEERQPHPSSTSPPLASQGQSKKSSQSSSSHRHPGPISLPPLTAFTLPPGVVLSPHAHPQSPSYHPGYPLSPMQSYSMGSPLHHPMGSPLHHPTHVHTPLHHPGHPQYPYHTHSTTPMHYGVITPHGLPPITPGMPPFTFLLPQARTQGQNGHGREEKGGEGGRSGHGWKNEGGRCDGQNRKIPAQPLYYAQSPHPPPQHMQYVPHMHPHLFSPGIPLSPGFVVSLSPGIMPPASSMPLSSPPSGVPVMMTPGVAMTPGVTMTPGAFWPHAPWINPAVGAPVHVHGDGQNGHKHPGGEGYFPPVSQPSGDTGYFPPMSSVANEILKEGSGFGVGSWSGSGDAPGENVDGGSQESGTESLSRGSLTNMSMTSPSPDPSRKNAEDVNRKGGSHAIKRTTSVQCEGGTSKRNGLPHRESNPEMTTATTKVLKDT
ncbi:hypothetical protein PAXRUDRAFT_619355 [Paxillus rubicundulus Ve08.2h10]|uniref:Unplaced genomic scaffold scaffold_54, whole genome shotgun sequence n=1 Tax=Paxillus rubicundulus Ve08.2h10 TaxID=930991 RepID=A0A0D0DKD4_9AGAM|nr:hypothetical protein PAXRUDRAFT_619355 [Paxillus rubicundulus Ve08.2h10]